MWDSKCLVSLLLSNLIYYRCKASYKVAYHLGVVGKPYTDGELVKRCLLDVFGCIDRGKETDYSSIALSHVPMQRRQCNIAQQL